MAIYTVGRRRVVIALLLSAALLLTLDLRGNPVLDTIRNGFSQAMSPVERAADVVTNPVQRAWNSYENYDDLERENQALRDQVDRQRGTQAAAEASIIDYNLLLALDNLPSLTDIPTAKAQVVGGAMNNIDQIVEINKGTDDNIAVGMAVVNQAGLVGRITQANAATSNVMLVTDSRFSVAVEILGGTGATSSLDDLEPSNTTPSGNTSDENDQRVEEAIDAEANPQEPTEEETGGGSQNSDESDTPGATTPLDRFDSADPPDLPEAGDEPSEPGVVTDEPTDTTDPTDTTLPSAEVPGDDAPVPTDPDGNPVDTANTTTTTTVAELEPEQLEKEFGALEGRGRGKPTQIRFLQDVPSLAVLEVGDLVETASGGPRSLAPPNIPVGQVINRADRAGVAGPLLEVELNADVEQLNFVRVVLFRPPPEAEE